MTLTEQTTTRARYALEGTLLEVSVSGSDSRWRLPALYRLLRDRRIRLEEKMGRQLKGQFALLPDPTSTDRHHRPRFTWDAFCTICWIDLIPIGYLDLV